METRDKKGSAPTQEETQQWTLYVNGASNENESGIGIMLINPGHTEYEALIARLCLTREL